MRFLLAMTLLFASQSFAAPSKQDLDQTAQKFLQNYTMQWGNFGMEFLKSATAKTYYSVSKYHDYDRGLSLNGIGPRIVGIFSTQDQFKNDLLFGILFDENGKAEKLVGTSPLQEECVPYLIYEPGTYTVYYTAQDRTSQATLLAARQTVIATLLDVLNKTKLVSGMEQLAMNLKPNSDAFERQDHLTITRGFQLRQEQINEKLHAVKIPGVGEAFASIARIGNPVMDPFNPQENAVCTEIK